MQDKWVGCDFMAAETFTFCRASLVWVENYYGKEEARLHEGCQLAGGAPGPGHMTQPAC